MKIDKVILLLLLGSLLSMSGIAFYYKLGWDRMDSQMREIAADVKTVNTTIKDLSGLYRRTRIGLLLTQLRSQNDPLIFLFGDSIVEQLYFPVLDATNIFNAGISGAKALESLPFLENIQKESRGPLVVLAMGTNDAFGEVVSTPEQFAAGYDALVSAVLASGRTAVLVTLPPLERDKPESRLFNGASLDGYNAIIREIGIRYGLHVADVNAVLTRRRLKIAVSQTMDGVHLNPAAAVVWRDTVYGVVRQALAQPGK